MNNFENFTFLEKESAYNNAKKYLNQLRRTYFDTEDQFGEDSPEAIQHANKIKLQRKIVARLENLAFPKQDKTATSLRYN